MIVNVPIRRYWNLLAGYLRQFGAEPSWPAEANLA